MTGKEFAENALKLVGEPYNKIDCIAVVRLAANIKCQGTNWLWRSFNYSRKYRYLVTRSDTPPDMEQLQDGLLVFRINWNKVPDGYTDKPNCHHVGVILGDTVIQSNTNTGVTQTEYNPTNWNACGFLKDIVYERPFMERQTNEQEIYHPDAELLTDHEILVRLYNYFFGID